MTRFTTERDFSRIARDNAPPAPIASLWSRTSMLKEMWDVVHAVGDWPGVTFAADHRGLCLSLHGVRLGRMRWSGRIDLPFGPELRDRLLAEKMASRDPDRPDRAVFDVRGKADVGRAVWLLRLAYLTVDPKVEVCG